MARKRTVARGFSLFKRTDQQGRSVWHAAKDLPPGPDGKRRRLDRSGATAREASERLHAASRELERQATAAQHVTVGEFLAQWLRDVVQPRRRPNTIALYTGTITRHVLPAIGTVRLADLKPAQVQRIYADQERAGHRAMAYITHSVLHNAFEVALAWELIERNPVARVKPPPLVKSEKQSLTTEQAQCLLAACSAHLDGVLFLVALMTGMRVGELCGLTWDRVDWQASLIHVDRQIQHEAGAQRGQPQPRFGPLKGRRPHVVYLPAWALERLQQHHDAQGFARQAAGDAWQDWGLVFPRGDGTPQRRGSVSRKWERLLADLGLPRLTIHGARHSHASLARAAGVPIEVASLGLGHANANLLLSTYSHPSEAAQRQAAEALGRLLWGEG